MECDRQNFLSFWTVFCSFCPFRGLWTQKIKILKKRKNNWRYYHFTNVYNKWQSYDICFFRYGVQQTKIVCHSGPFFALLPPQPKKWKFWKTEKKNPGDIIILHKCTKNHGHVLYCSLDMIHNGFTYYFSFLGYSSPFYLPNSPKNENLEKVKKIPGDIIILQYFTKNHDHKLPCF